MIDVSVVQYFSLTWAVSMWSQILTLVHTVSPTWTRCCNAEASLQLVFVAWSCRFERMS